MKFCRRIADLWNRPAKQTRHRRPSMTVGLMGC